MKLIDSDELLNKVNQIKYLRKIKARMLVDECKPIEAIPINFLIKTQEEYCKRYGEVYKAVVLNILEDWRKENESNSNAR